MMRDRDITRSYDPGQDERLNRYSPAEIAELVKGATIRCIMPVIRSDTMETTFTAGRTYTVEACSYSLLVGVKNDLGEKFIFFADDYRRHFQFAAGPTPTTEVLEVIHLTETGFHAGRRRCNADRADGQRNVHAAYAPLRNAAFREKVCLDCLKVWANEAYEDGDIVPDYVAELRKHGKAGQGD